MRIKNKPPTSGYSVYYDQLLRKGGTSDEPLLVLLESSELAVAWLNAGLGSVK
jgi:hypothetical protein